MRRKGCGDLFCAIYDHHVQPEDSCAQEMFLFRVSFSETASPI